MKKIISLVTVVMLIIACVIPVSAGSMMLNEDNINDSKAFKPDSFSAAKASSSIKLDGVKDAAYTSDVIKVDARSKHDGFGGTTGATAEAYAAWHGDFLYVYVEVDDKTPHYDGSYWLVDGVEIFVDYDQKSDGKKTKFNRYTTDGGEEIYAAQMSFVRGAATVAPTNISTINETFKELLSTTSAKVVDNKANGYAIEVAVPLKGTDGKYLLKSKVIGFTININDDPGGTGRQNMTCTTNSVQAFAWEWSDLFDNLTLEDANLTWSSRTVTTNVDTNYSEYDPNAPKPSSTPAAPESTIESTPDEDISSTTTNEPSSDADTPVTSQEDADEPGDNDTDTDVGADADDDKTDPDDESKGGLPIGALIGIIAGGVVVLAAAALVVILVLKKKKAAPTDAE